MTRANGEGAFTAGQAAVPEAPMPRRIVYTAVLELLVEDLDSARKELLRLIEEHQGFVGSSETGGSPGQPRSGHWTLRIPVSKFSAFMESAAKLGEPIRNKVDSQDVTEQFVDLESRLRNKRVEEERLQKLLKEVTGKLTEVLEVERELTRVRGEIEQTQGRLQQLATLSELSTATVTLRERRDYAPPKAPAFGTSVSRSFSDSLTALVHFGQGLVLVGAAIVPWLPIVGIVSGGAWWAVRRRKT